MRFVSASLVTQFVIFAGTVAAVDMPPLPQIVARFAETTDLWQAIFIGNFLPGRRFYPINAPVSEAWIDFIRQNGAQKIYEG